MEFIRNLALYFVNGHGGVDDFTCISSRDAL